MRFRPCPGWEGVSAAGPTTRLSVENPHSLSRRTAFRLMALQPSGAKPLTGGRLISAVSCATGGVGRSVSGVLVRSSPTSVPRTLAQGVGVLSLSGLEIRRGQGVRRTQSLPDEPDFRTLEVTSQCRPIAGPRCSYLKQGMIVSKAYARLNAASHRVVCLGPAS